MTPENPKRLWAFFVRGAPYAGTSRHSVEASTAFGWGATPVSEYVRADVAAAETAEAVRVAAAALGAIGEVLAQHGCDCDCGCDTDGHRGDCAPCLACRVSAELSRG